MSTPMVSVIVPTFDRLTYLQAAIASVVAQTVGDWELIVVDDGSSDGTPSFFGGLADTRIRALRLPHSGNPSRVRNAGIRIARGRYLAFLDSDDLWEPAKLEVQLALMRARPERGWSYTRERFIDECGGPAADQGFPVLIPYEGEIFERLLTFDAMIAMPTVMAERALVEAAGGFDEQQRFGEDYDLWLRLALLSEVSASPEALSAVRLHQASYSADRIGAHSSRVSRECLGRRRIGHLHMLKFEVAAVRVTAERKSLPCVRIGARLWLCRSGRQTRNAPRGRRHRRRDQAQASGLVQG